MDIAITSKFNQVAIVMTVFNRSIYLGEAIKSVIAQTFADWQLIIWDDGSTDDAPIIADNYARLDERIRSIRMPHLGRARALKGAISISRSSYIGILDSDDLLDPMAIAATADILGKFPATGLVYTDRFTIDQFGNVIASKSPSMPYSKERLLTNFMTHHFKLCRRDIYNSVGGIDLEFDSAQDWDLCLKISEIADVQHLAQQLYYYRRHPDSISSSQPQFQTERSIKAIENALARRGLDRTLTLDSTSGFKLIAKQSQG